MAKTWAMTVEGADALAAALAQLGADVAKEVTKDALQAGARPIQSTMARRMKRGPEAPHAAENVKVTMGRTGHAVAIGPSRAFGYWLFQEFGTVNHPAQPAMRPAFDEEHGRALQFMLAEFWAGIRHHLPRVPTTASSTFR